jgi:hypothetical protein
MEAIATREGHGKGCGPRGGPIGYTAKKKTRRKRNRGCQELLSVARQPLPLPPLPPPHTARLLHCLGLRYQDWLRRGPPLSLWPKISDFQERRLKRRTASIWRPKSDAAEFGQLL